MLLNIYGLKDNVVGEFIFFFQQQNEGTLKRILKGALLSKEPNCIQTDLKDKSVYELGSINTNTGKIEPQQPVFVCNISDIRLELIREIKIAKAEAGDENPTAEEVCKDD